MRKFSWDKVVAGIIIALAWIIYFALVAGGFLPNMRFFNNP